MPCLSCARPGWPLCPPCRTTLRPAPDRALGAGLVGSAVWAHVGSGRRLVGRLKYDGVLGVARLAASMAGAAPPDARALVPIPRVWVRRAGYGVDAAEEYALALGRRWGIPVVRAFSTPIWAPRRAGRLRRPGPPDLALLRRVPGAVVVDDVITSGSTVRLAADRLDAARAMAITMVVKSPASQGVLRTMGDRTRR